MERRVVKVIVAKADERRSFEVEISLVDNDAASANSPTVTAIYTLMDNVPECSPSTLEVKLNLTNNSDHATQPIEEPIGRLAQA